MKVVVRVHPGARQTAVGGSFGGALVVRVVERAVDGKATAAVLRALADAFGVPGRDVALISGAAGRTKAVEIVGADPVVLEGLLAR